ncbi:MAG TPA: methylmalonyl Co-A mutase-associated GTPase MeaB [Terracidiphilus sp.]|nr:methylmalonyl Co-A mutase-associated GTPase MeaB [Terracidiphilus sp.]
MKVEAEAGQSKPTYAGTEPSGDRCLTKRGERLSVAQYVSGIQAGNRTILAKAITLIESSRASDRDLAEEVMESCLSGSGDSIRVGITGVPGAGKSTLIDALGRYVITVYGGKIAVLAVDPTSQVGGGSILGDKTRMNFLASSDKTFIRPSPTRGVLGGVARHTREAIALCEAAGYGNVFVETVGVGQSETAVRDMVDFFLLVTIPGAGDELQGIKRGVTEMADAVVINKVDGDHIHAAERARADAEAALHLLPAYSQGWTSPALMCSARTGRGIPEIWSCILDHHSIGASTGWLNKLRREQRLRSFRENVEAGLWELFVSNPLVKQRMPHLEQEVATGSLSAVRGARKLLSLHPSDGTTADKNCRT